MKVSWVVAAMTFLYTVATPPTSGSYMIADSMTLQTTEVCHGGIERMFI
jgi:hypothetical protein